MSRQQLKRKIAQVLNSNSTTAVQAPDLTAPPAPAGKVPKPQAITLPVSPDPAGPKTAECPTTGGHRNPGVYRNDGTSQADKPKVTTQKPSTQLKKLSAALQRTLRTVEGQTMNQKMTKLSAAQQAQLQQLDTIDAANAAELGFAKVARDLGLGEKEFETFYQAGCERMQQSQTA